MNKVIRDGKVAVLYSPTYGAGWYSWNKKHKDCLFEPQIVSLVEDKDNYSEQEFINKINELAIKLYGEDFYAGGGKDLVIQWLPQGMAFKIEEYDGCESIEYVFDDMTVA